MNHTEIFPKNRSRTISSSWLPTFALGKRNRAVLRRIPEPLIARNMYEEDYYEEERTYERYNGSYAQDVEGWSDQDIDDVFDGDPEAYWNID